MTEGVLDTHAGLRDSSENTRGHSSILRRRTNHAGPREVNVTRGQSWLMFTDAFFEETGAGGLAKCSLTIVVISIRVSAGRFR